jgi:SNF2 family DNA or RNA helicase
MTGTPLENHVEEMCSLIDLLRPDMSGQIRSMANYSQLPQFRETLSPVYLRRTRQQVLKELPPIEEEREWCQMTAQDHAGYLAALQTRNFNVIRRVSFLQDKLTDSSKALRLTELCSQAVSEGRKAVVFSFFRETIDRIAQLLGSSCAGVITGDTKVEKRQHLIDMFSEAEEGCVLVCQVQAGGTGLNIQAASIVIFAEPQIKPSLEKQALSRVYRMGQVRNVLVYHLLCPGMVDDLVVQKLEEKQAEFDAYADESAMAAAAENLIDSDWIKEFIESETKKYLPRVITPQ